MAESELQLRLSFSKDVGLTVIDASPYANDGTQQATPEYTPMPLGRAALFDSATTPYLTVTNDSKWVLQATHSS